MAKFHVNPNNGKAGPCSAKRSCPFGDLETEHYGTVAEAQQAYEGSMADQTFSNVVSLSSVKAKRASAASDELAQAREASGFDKGWERLGKGILSKADIKLVEDVAAGKKVSDEKLDQFLDAHQDLETVTPYNRAPEAANAKAVMDYLRAVRAQSGSPSTLPTIETFDPSTQSMFSNASARSAAHVMGKAIRREAAHGEWMDERAEEDRRAAQFARQDGDEAEAQAYEQAALNSEKAAMRSKARTQAQLRELQYLFDTDEKFAGTANADVRRLLAQGSFRGAGQYAGVPIGTVRKVK